MCTAKRNFYPAVNVFLRNVHYGDNFGGFKSPTLQIFYDLREKSAKNPFLKFKIRFVLETYLH